MHARVAVQDPRVFAVRDLCRLRIVKTFSFCDAEVAEHFTERAFGDEVILQQDFTLDDHLCVRRNHTGRWCPI